MATYTELYNIMGNSALRNRVEVALIVAANTIRGEAVATENHANRLIWAAQAFDNPKGLAQKVLMAVLASNKSEAVSVIESASDEIIQVAVDGVVNLFATGV